MGGTTRHGRTARGLCRQHDLPAGHCGTLYSHHVSHTIPVIDTHTHIHTHTYVSSPRPPCTPPCTPQPTKLAAQRLPWLPTCRLERVGNSNHYTTAMGYDYYYYIIIQYSTVPVLSAQLTTRSSSHPRPRPVCRPGQTVLAACRRRIAARRDRPSADARLPQKASANPCAQIALLPPVAIRLLTTCMYVDVPPVFQALELDSTLKQSLTCFFFLPLLSSSSHPYPAIVSHSVLAKKLHNPLQQTAVRAGHHGTIVLP